MCKWILFFQCSSVLTLPFIPHNLSVMCLQQPDRSETALHSFPLLTQITFSLALVLHDTVVDLLSQSHIGAIVPIKPTAPRH